MLDRWKRGITVLWLTIHVFLLGNCAGQNVENSFIRTPSMLDAKGPVAGSIADLSWFMIILGSLIYIGVMAYLFRAMRGNRSYNFQEELQRPNAGTTIVLTWGVGFTALVFNYRDAQ